MGYDIGPRIGIEGFAEFKRNLKSIDDGLKVNASEMQKVSAEYDKNDKSITALTAKNDVLSRSISSQSEKVEVLRQALEKSAKETGESSSQTMEWQVKMNKAETELANMNRQLGENEEAMQKAGKGTVSLGDAVRSLSGIVGIDVPPAFDGMVSKLDTVSASGAALVGVLAGVGAALIKSSLDTAKVADDILTQSSITGLATDALQELNYASEQLDVSTETVTGSMTKMIKSMGGARDGSKQQSEAFEKLRVNVAKGNGELRDANDVFYEVIDKLSKMTNETERDAISMQIFGRSARELNPLIQAGSGALAQFAQEAHNIGYVMDAGTLEKFGELDNAMQKLSKTGDAVKQSFALALLPPLTAFVEVITSIPAPVLTMIITLVGMITTIVLLVKAVNEMTSTASSITGFFKGLDSSSLKTTAIILGVVAALIALAVIIAVIMGKTKDLERSMKSVGDSVGQISGTVATTQNSYRNVPRYARGTQYHPGGPAVINEEGPEEVVLPRGTKVVPAGKTAKNGVTNIFYVTIAAETLKQAADAYEVLEQLPQAYNAG